VVCKGFKCAVCNLKQNQKVYIVVLFIMVWWFCMSKTPNSSSESGAGSSLTAQSVPQDFLARVKQATERMRAEGIELWRPNVSEELQEIFYIAIVSDSEGCTNGQCNHNSHDPASPIIKLVPKSGKLVYLGNVEYGEKTSYYYALFQNNTTLYFEVVSEPFRWQKIYQIESFLVPDFLLVKFAKGEGNA